MAVERLFIAVAIPPEVRESIRSVLPHGMPGRPVRPEHWHLTLRFLGDTDASRRQALVDALRGAALGPAFAIRFGGLGAFPNAERARVVWIGAREGARECEALAAAVESAARSAGFPPASRAFSTHLTLSRLDPPRPVRGLVDRPADASVPLAVRAVTLYRSDLSPQGPRYTSLERFGIDPRP